MVGGDRGSPNGPADNALAPPLRGAVSFARLRRGSDSAPPLLPSQPVEFNPQRHEHGRGLLFLGGLAVAVFP